MPLWHFHSEVLKGFYASEVYASARTKGGAIQYAGEAFDNWAADHHAQMGYYPLVEDYLDEEGLADTQLAEIRTKFLEEADAKFQNMGTATILHRS